MSSSLTLTRTRTRSRSHWLPLEPLHQTPNRGHSFKLPKWPWFHSTMSASLLYCNHDESIVLLDLPTSIQEAQRSSRRPRSSAPLQRPYPSTEPRGQKRDRLLASAPLHHLQYHVTLQSQIREALHHIKTHYNSAPWCLPRYCPEVESFDSIPSPVGRLTLLPTAASQRYSNHVPIVLSPAANRFSSVASLENKVVCNGCSIPTQLSTVEGHTFLVSPSSVLLLSSITAGMPAFTQATTMLLAAKVPNVRIGGFDLLLLDPPWKNRSVRHAQTYRTTENQEGDPFAQTVHVVSDLLAEDGLVAIWVTNKPTVRAQVMQAYEEIGLHLREEWVWIKTTTQGEPVTQLEGIWRHPYELCLLFRRTPSQSALKRRIIAAVADLHSRKPSLKTLLERQLPANYQALELFARSLTCGWWSWGSEVLKFQGEHDWEPDCGRPEIH